MNQMMIPFVMADTHFNHNKCIEWCQRPKNFNELLIKNISKLTINNVFICLGDFAWKPGKIYESLLKHLKCKKILVRGNHDKCSNSWYLRYGWDFVCQQFKDEYYGKKILFSHKPQAWDGWYDLNLHGHFHNLHPERWELELTKIYTHRHVLIAPELTNYEPISLNMIVDKIKKQERENEKNRIDPK